MENKIFTAIDGKKLNIKSTKSAVIFELVETQENKKYDFKYVFDDNTFNELFNYLEVISTKIWAKLEPKEANSMSSDYYEYYDKKLDNNGYLSISKNILSIERPSLSSLKLYQFNKKKMESFIYDYKKIKLGGKDKL